MKALSLLIVLCVADLSASASGSGSFVFFDQQVESDSGGSSQSSESYFLGQATPAEGFAPIDGQRQERRSPIFHSPLLPLDSQDAELPLAVMLEVDSDIDEDGISLEEHNKYNGMLSGYGETAEMVIFFDQKESLEQQIDTLFGGVSFANKVGVIKCSIDDRSFIRFLNYDESTVCYTFNLGEGSYLPEEVDIFISLCLDYAIKNQFPNVRFLTADPITRLFYLPPDGYKFESVEIKTSPSFSMHRQRRWYGMLIESEDPDDYVPAGHSSFY